MKNVLLTFALLLTFGMSFGQLKVWTDGDVSVGSSVTSPSADLQINSKPGSIASTLRFKTPNTNAIFNYFDAGSDGLSAQWNVDMVTGKPDGFVSLGYFRSTNTTGNVNFIVFEGNNTPNSNIRLSGNTNSYFNAFSGNVGVGTQSPLSTMKLHVEGDAYKTQGGDAWSIPSDRRLKSNIQDFNKGLDLIKQINTVQYEYNGKAGTTLGEHQIGVVAQELEKIAPFMVNEAKYRKIEVDENGEETVLEEEKILTVNTSALKWILVNTVQEQQAMIETQNERIERLEEIVLNLSNATSTQTIEIRDSRLGQNAPNPFTQKTVINYTVPTKAQNAVLQVFDMNGQLLKSVNVAQGNGQLTINAGELAAGTYSYNLVVDGAIVDTKKMVLTK